MLSRIARVTHVPRSDALAVLNYGRIGKSRLGSIPTARFREQLSYLAQSNAIRLLDWAQPLPVSNVPTVLVTFDEDPADDWHEVLSILDEFQVKALFFARPDWSKPLDHKVGCVVMDEWPAQHWRSLEVIVQRGHALGLKGGGSLWRSVGMCSQVEESLQRSIDRMNSRLGVRPTSVAEPMIFRGDDVLPLERFWVAQGFFHLFTQEHKTLRYSSVQAAAERLICIPRLTVDAEDSACQFREKLFGYWDLTAMAQWLQACISARRYLP